MAKNDGGPAFPGTMYYQSKSVSYVGMTLRDWFAGRTLAEVMNAVKGVTLPKGAPQSAVFSAIAEQAFAIADAMLAERDKCAN